MPGFTPDTDTVALWRLDDVGSPATWADSRGAYALTNHGVQSTLVGHFTNIKAGAFQRATARYLQSAASTAIDVVGAGDITFLAWFMPNGLANYEALISINDAGHNNPFSVGLTAAGCIYGQQENASSVVISSTVPSTYALPPNQLVRVAVRRVSLGGGNYQWDFFQNGARVHTWLPTGGLRASTNASFWLGGSGYGTPSDPLDGLMSDVLIESRGLTDDEILADYTSYQTTMTAARAGQPHVLDADTYALWRLNEAYNATSWVDACGRATLDSAAAGAQSTPGLFAAPARHIGPSSFGRRTTAAPAADVLAISSGDWTVECWAYLGSYTTGTGVVVDLLDTAYAHGAIRTHILNNGHMGLLYTSGGVNDGINDSGVAIPTNAWVHLAWRRYQEADSSWSIDFWIDDQMVAKSLGAAVPDALNVSDCQWSIGIHPAAGAAGEWNGNKDCFLDDVRVSTVKRSDAEIQQAYYDGIGAVAPVSTTEPTGHAYDSNTYALWRADDDGSTLLDQTGRFHLTATAPYPTSVKGQVGKARAYTGSEYFTYSGTIGATHAAVFAGEITVEALVWLDGSISGTNPCRILEIGADGETSSTNVLFGFDVRSGGTVLANWEYGAGTGTNALIQTPAGRVPVETMTHVAVVRRLESGGTTMAVDVYINGKLTDTFAGLTKPDGGSSDTIRMGADLTSPGTPVSIWAGMIDEVRVSNVARTANEIKASYDACFPALAIEPVEPGDAIGLFPRHSTNANTALHYKGVGDSEGSTTLIDEAGTRPLTIFGPLTTVYAAGEVPYSRRSLDNNMMAYRNGDSAFTTAMQGEWTMQAWIEPDVLGSTRYLFSLGQSGETLSSNYVTSIRLENTGFLSVFQEYGSGINSQVTQSVGEKQVAGVEKHIAIVKQLATGTQYNYSFYVNGVFQQTVGPLESGQGGDTANNMIVLFGDMGTSSTVGVGNGQNFQGAIRSFHISSAVLDATTIAANAANATKMHATDGNTLVHWPLTDSTAAKFVDSGYASNHLYSDRLAFPFRSSMVVGGTHSWYFPGGNSVTAGVVPSAVTTNETLRQVLLGEFTFGCILRTMAEDAADRGIFTSTDQVGTDSGGSDTNYVFAANILGGSKLAVECEYGTSGITTNDVASGDVIPKQGRTMRVIYRKRIVSTQSYFDVFLDGELVATSPLGPLPDGGATGLTTLGRFDPAHSNWNDLLGYLEDVFLVDYAMTDTEIASYVPVASAGTAPKPPGPTLANLSPVGRISEDSVVEFDLLFSDGLSNLTISVHYADGDTEIIYSNGVFTAAYSGSMVTDVTGGKHVTIERTDGWLESPNIEIDAVDMYGSAL